jgi:hypothetical protein
MAVTHCPLCYTLLETRDVAPCAECGHHPEEIEEALAGIHSYAEMRIFGDLSIVLCNFCQVDFGSIDPTFFGLPYYHRRVDLRDMKLVRPIYEIQIGKDKYCPECRLRLVYLEFVANAREYHAEKFK